MVNRRARLTVFLVVAATAVFGLFFARQLISGRGLNREAFAEKNLEVLTYSTFISSTGPGPDLIKNFEKTCGCKVNVTATSDAGLLLERLKVSGADVVIGLDQALLEAAARDFLWNRLNFENVIWRVELQNAITESFLPFDWSPLTFVYREDGRPVPKKLSELTHSQYRKQFAVEDPHTSTPGLQFVNWIRDVKGRHAEQFFKEFKPNVFAITPSWSLAYGLFKKEQVRFVFSYLTSLAFHWGIEKDRKYQVLSLEEGHPVQIEYLGVPASCKQCELGARFADFLLSPDSQKIIMEKNFMIPAVDGLEKGTIFAELPHLKTLEIKGSKDLQDWDRVFSK